MKFSLGVALLAALSGSAFGDDTSSKSVPAPSAAPEQRSWDLSYLLDGGMIPFFWVPFASRLALDLWVQPPSTPRWFSANEGGATPASWEVPSYAVAGLSASFGLAVLASGDRSRWYHLKGFGQAAMTSVFITGGMKNLFGRHRPDWSPDDEDAGQRRSFPSGHSTQAFVTATYAILYLRGHVFDRLRGDQTLPWWEAATYAGIGLGAAALAGERVLHERHNVSDVVVGGALGIASSALFYRFQERRFREREAKDALHNLTITPSITKEAKTIGLSFDW